jgi:hypothetical protein
VASRADGYKNKNWGKWSAIDGNDNSNKSEGSYVSGGSNEVDAASIYSLVGGYDNILENAPYAIVGGNRNKVYSQHSLVAGASNIVRGKGSIVTGQNNELSAETENVQVGGWKNKLEGTVRYSFIAGYENVLTNAGNSIIIGNKHQIDAGNNLISGTNIKTNRSYTALIGHSLIADTGENY